MTLSGPLFSLTRFSLRLLVIAAILLTTLAQPAEAARRKKQAAAPAPKYAALVIDATSGRVLHQDNADAKRHPASLTKMMTLYMTFAALERKQLTLNQRLFVSPQAASQSPSKLGLRAGDRLRVEDAILGLVTQSANDAAVVLAEAMGGSEARFAQMMTQTARKLGMSSTIFKNASGLPQPQQVTTARDMAKLALGLLRHYPNYYPYFSTAAFEYESAVHRNHNRLMARFDGMDGIKTGFINASGFNLVASAVRDNHRLIGVVFGGRTAAGRDNQMEDLMISSFDKARALDRQTRTAKNNKARAPVTVAAVAQPAAPQAAATPTPTVIADNSLASAPANEGEGDAELQAEPASVTRQQIAAAMSTQPDDSWGIQIGAYNDRAAAQRALALIADQNAALLGKSSTRVTAVDTPSGTIFRARLVGLEQNTARTACSSLQKQNRSCFILPPAGAADAWLATAE
jgi:D-alanyl-D-alanine carboxypeptidase